MDELIKWMKHDCACCLRRDEDEPICAVCQGINEIIMLRQEVKYWRSVAERMLKING